MILRHVVEEDLPVFFEHQLEPEGIAMAAFPARARDTFLNHWHTRVLRPENVTRTIVSDGVVVGYIGSWDQEGKRLVAYWIGRQHWGKGLGTRALRAFLEVEPIRPLHAWVASHNIGSIRVLEKCGFERIHSEDTPAADGVVEVLLRLGST